MDKILLINRIQVQNANAIAGFTAGFPAITHFLGFTHNLYRKLRHSQFSNRVQCLTGCAVVAHEYEIHRYGKYGERFTQNRTPPYLHSHDKSSAPPVIEEAKMNMTVSLMIGISGDVGNQTEEFIKWCAKQCFFQRLAGGTILDIKSLKIFDLNSRNDFYLLKRQLLPGFLLMDRSEYLAQHYEDQLSDNPDAELLESWLDFSSLKQKARPKSDLIDKHLKKIDVRLFDSWNEHLKKPYDGSVPAVLKDYFSGLEPEKNKQLLAQWLNYINPNEKTSADWEYLPKPMPGYLVPIMTGYKAISPVYDNADVANTRDSETPVCFVESVHSIGEWLGINRLREPEDIGNCLWEYRYEENWYLCQQKKKSADDEMSFQEEEIPTSPLDEIF